MIFLYQGSGAGGFELIGSALPTAEWNRLKRSVCGLLEHRSHQRAADLLRDIPFEVFEATNYFNDEFSVLHISVPLERYVDIDALANNPDDKLAFRHIATAISEVGPFIRHIAVSLDTESGPEPVSLPPLQFTSEVVERALSDAERLLTSAGAVSAVDRVHTALHGYIRNVCQQVSITHKPDASITELFKLLREQHPALQGFGPRTDDIVRTLRAMATVLDSMNSLRNRASVAHPNESLLEEPEAMLVINSARTVLHYIDAKLR